MRERIGRYRVLRKLGQGGMGIVYSARDDDLKRDVAIKTIAQGAVNDKNRKRFRREARVAASLNHRNSCQVYEIGEEAGTLFIVMELLHGEPLSDRIRRGPLPLAEAVGIGLEVLAALKALHERGLIHRDLKPANVFLTPDAVKILDFGLARPLELPDGERTNTRLTEAGTIVGTPHYMAPEQLQCRATDARADLFAVAAMLFEMLTGRRVFEGRSAIEVFHSTLYEHPPLLTGSPAIAAVGGVVRSTLSKRPEDRPSTAAAMADALRSALACADSGATPVARAMTRLIVLPFRLLRADADIDFLAFALPDAITSALSGLESLVVRSSMTAAQFDGVSVDLKRIAAEAEVDLLLAGTMLRAGDELRVAAQLLEAPGCGVVWSHTVQAQLHDVFQVQDQIVQRIVDSLAASLTLREQRILRRDVPATARAYELYLRGNQLSLDPVNWELARELYERCVEDDSRYAPAWARLGRIHRVVAKYAPDRGPADSVARAEVAFRRALDLNPDLAIAHNLYAHLEADCGRAREAMTRLLDRARTGTADPELFAALVLTTRYCGLTDASLAAHARARELDPTVRTSVAYTYFITGDHARAAAHDADPDGPVAALCALEREAAIEAWRPMLRPTVRRVWRDTAEFIVAALEDRRDDMYAAARRALHAGLRDPEAHYYFARVFAFCGEEDEALRMLGEVIEDGFFCVAGLRSDSWLDPLRARPEFDRLLAGATARRDEAGRTFVAAGGNLLLRVAGPPV